MNLMKIDGHEAIARDVDGDGRRAVIEQSSQVREQFAREVAHIEQVVGK